MTLFYALYFCYKKNYTNNFIFTFLAHTRPIFLKLILLFLCKVAIQRTSIFMYKLMNKMLPAALDYLIIKNNDLQKYNSRQMYQLHGSRPTCKSVVHCYDTPTIHIVLC